MDGHGAENTVARRAIGILVWDGFLTSEVTAPVEVLGAARHHGALPDTGVLLVSATGDEVTSHEGLRVRADTTVIECPDLDVLIVPSSADMAPILADEQVVAFVAAQGRTVGALASHCAGAFLLGAAGLLDDRRATTYPGGEEELRATIPTAVIVDDDVVQNGNLITSSGATVSYRAALLLLEELTDATVAQAVADDLYLDRLVATGTRG